MKTKTKPPEKVDDKGLADLIKNRKFANVVVMNDVLNRLHALRTNASWVKTTCDELIHGKGDWDKTRPTLLKWVEEMRKLLKEGK